MTHVFVETLIILKETFKVKHVIVLLLSLALFNIVLPSTECTISYASEMKGPCALHDSYGKYRIVKRKKDLYIERLDGSESRRITHTPWIDESLAYFVKRENYNGNYIVYTEVIRKMSPRRIELNFYLIKRENNDNKRRKISKNVFHYLSGQPHY